jgi:hypothetical protein
MPDMTGNKKAPLCAATVLAFLACAPSKTAPQNSQQMERDLTMTTIAEKQTFVLHEKVRTRVEFRNSGPNTYCLPKPPQDCTNDYPGSAVTTGHPVPDTREYEIFICHYDTGGPHTKDLESEIRLHWIILAPNTTYLTDGADAVVDLDRPGEWQLETVYDPPVGAFNPDAVRKEIMSATGKVGCIVPAKISSKPITIQVVAVKKI